jgi:hypothetical protein
MRWPRRNTVMALGATRLSHDRDGVVDGAGDCVILA